MKRTIEWIGVVENWKIIVGADISGDIFSILKNTLSHMRIQIATEAKKYLWYPSVWYHGPDSGKDEKWFDCSWFVTYILGKYGVAKENIRHTNEYFDEYGIAIHKEAIQPWDLVFFSRDGLAPKHIGIVISHDEYIHAPGKDGTVVEIGKIENQAIVNDSTGKIYTRNPIWFKRIILERDDNQKEEKRRNKII